MELPNNITQIGAFDPHSKVYAEDYVMSYLKKCNQHAADKPVGMAFYGRMLEEEDKKYYFFYGAATIESLNKEVTHLSQAQRQEIEKIRGFHFREYLFLGYKILDGLPVEGFYLYEQNIGRYISGYATFAEKNDCMLNFMMDHEVEEAQPEMVDESRYRAVKEKQEQRREEAYFHYKRKKAGMGTGMHAVALLGAAVLGFVVYQNMDKPMMASYLQKGTELVEQVKDSFDTNKASEEMTPVSVNSDQVVVIDTRERNLLVVEEELEKAMISENEPKESESESETELEAESEAESETESEAEAASEVVEPSEETSPVTVEPMVYTVQKGDTLISISTIYYGTKDKVDEICQLNHITNPDSIQEGRKIFLP